MPTEQELNISEKEFAVIREISNNHLPDQRTIAIRTGISLGLTNLLIKRLIKKGYIKAKQLNQKKIQYLLTPQGFTEKAKKSYHFTMKTIHLFKNIKEKIQALILEEYKKGACRFCITGGNELADIAEFAANQLKDANINCTRLKDTATDENIASLIIESLENGSTKHSIDLMNYLSEAGQNDKEGNYEKAI